jgi:hypothetical protein
MSPSERSNENRLRSNSSRDVARLRARDHCNGNRLLEIRQATFRVNQTASGSLHQNAQRACDGKPLFTCDADAEFFVHEYQISVRSLRQLNRLTLPGIKSCQAGIREFLNLLDHES